MTCHRCNQWAATTREQLDNRLRRMAGHPKADVFPCEICHGRDWATTDKFLREDFSVPPSLWTRFLRTVFRGPS
jgi:hypothetical protein